MIINGRRPSSSRPIGILVTNEALIPPKKSFMSEQEIAAEKGFQLWPKWAPVAAIALMLGSQLVQGIYNHATRDEAVNQLTMDVKSLALTMTSLGAKVDSDIAAVNQRIDLVNADRAEKHKEYEADLIETRATQAQLLEISKEHSGTLNRIEDDLDKRPIIK